MFGILLEPRSMVFYFFFLFEEISEFLCTARHPTSVRAII